MRCAPAQVWEHDGGDWQRFMAAPPYTRVLLDLHRCCVGRSCWLALMCEGLYSLSASVTLKFRRTSLVDGPEPM